MAMVSEFVAAVNQICSERGINPDDVYTALETAVLAAYKKEIDPEGDLRVEMDRDSGVFKVIATKDVVAKVEDNKLQVGLKQAQAMQKGLKVGDKVEIEMPIEEFGRIAAQTAKQVVLQKIRDSERDAVMHEFSGKVGEVFTALMQRMQNGRAVFEIGKATAYMPQEEQVSNEFYKIGERYKVILKEIEETPRGQELIVSRAAPEFLKELFRMEVPEIESGVVEIKACAREAGSRSKMAVTSHQEGVDPIGSCVGQRGMRIANIMSELGEEKIDIVEWSEEPEDFVAKALSPAKVEKVEISNSVAKVTVSEDQQSLAIGREGQNARLAAKLTGYRIDVVGDGASTSSASEGSLNEEKVDGNSGGKSAKKAAKSSELDKSLASKLEKAGKAPEEVKGWSVEQLLELDGIGKATAEKIYNSLNN